MKQKYDVEILGMPLHIQTEEEEETLRENARIIEKRVNDLIYRNARVTKGQATLFLALDYLAENAKLRAENEKLKEKLAAK